MIQPREGNGPDAHPLGAPIELRGIRKRYAGTTAVDRVSLRIAAGEFVSFLGPSGSGKTTTLLMIAGFISPTEGEILLGGDDITRLPPHRRNIGMVYQNYALFPHMTVHKNVAFPLRMRGVPRAEIAKRVARALDLVRLTGMDNRLPGQLSGGQQQRVALARALVFEPPLLLMDEPLGALDKKLREELQVEIKRIQREIRSTVIYVTHDQDEALSLSDRVVVMNLGRIEQVGPPSELYERPRTRFVADFIGSSNFLDATIVSAGRPVLARTKAGTTIELPTVKNAAVGMPLTIALRPERLQLKPAGASVEGSCPGRVLDVSYFGTVQRYQIRLDSGDALIVVRPNMGEAPLPAGAAVSVSWQPGDAWVIPEHAEKSETP